MSATALALWKDDRNNQIVGLFQDAQGKFLGSLCSMEKWLLGNTDSLRKGWRMEDGVHFVVFQKSKRTYISGSAVYRDYLTFTNEPHLQRLVPKKIPAPVQNALQKAGAL